MCLYTLSHLALANRIYDVRTWRPSADAERLVHGHCRR